MPALAPVLLPMTIAVLPHERSDSRSDATTRVDGCVTVLVRVTGRSRCRHGRLAADTGCAYACGA